MAQTFTSASQPITSAEISAASQPTSHSHPGEATDLLDLKLPPELLKLIAQHQASGQLTELLNRPLQPTPAVKAVAKAGRLTARSRSQPNILKSKGVSTYARGMSALPTPRPVPQPLEATLYWPPPIKARARRAAQATKGKATAAMPVVADARGNCAQDATSLSGVPRVTARPSAPSQAIAVASTASTVPPVVAARSSPFWGERAKTIPMPALTKSVSEQALAISQLPGLRHLPVSTIEKLLPRVRGHGAAEEAKRQGSSKSSTPHESPRPQHLEAPEAPTREPHPAAQLPESVPPLNPPVFPECWSMTNFPTWVPGTMLPAAEPSCGPEQPSANSQMFGQLPELIKNHKTPCNTTTVEQQNTEVEPFAAPEFLLDFGFDYSPAVEEQSETQIALPTYEDIERSLSALPNHPGHFTEPERDVIVDVAETRDRARFNVEFLDESWKGLVDFEGSVGV
ncbi:hypothetical protein F5148DRAFT_1154664 [Russula earlei]|uniref:Uncharacterized protein n=1 Tax=Russula earlei TaxID=71964 RepID=A0ACC0TSB9_9AGAM|nr:hypothetical protein F5148DRAFT_1154664 [Russula earlei]